MRRAVSSVTAALGLVGATVAVAGAARQRPARPPGSVVRGGGAAARRGGAADPAAGRSSARSPTSGCGSCPAWWRPRTATSSINDGTEQESRKRVFFLDTNCKVVRKEPATRWRAVRHRGPRRVPGRQDPLDRRHRRQRRPAVSVARRWRSGAMPVSGRRQPKLHRLSYPERQAARRRGAADRRRRDAADHHEGAPPARPRSSPRTAPLKTGDTEPVPMKKVGDDQLPKTDTENPLAPSAGSRSPARPVAGRLAGGFAYLCRRLRVRRRERRHRRRLTTGKPRVTAAGRPVRRGDRLLADGKTFLTVSDAGHLEETTRSTSSATPPPRRARRTGQ